MFSWVIYILSNGISMELVKEKDINFDSFDKFIELVLDMFYVCTLIMLKKSSPLRFIFKRIKVFPKGFLINAKVVI